MFSLSPLKILIVVVVALVLVGPDKLPGLARQVGGAWKAFRSFSNRVEDEVRSNLPDLPSTSDIARFARSPVALLDSLASIEKEELEPDPGAAQEAEVSESHDTHLHPDPGAPAPSPEGSLRAVAPPAEPRQPRPARPAPTGFDPSLN